MAIISKLNSPLLALLALAGFVWLAQYSLREHGYSAEERKAMDDLHVALDANDYLTQLQEVALYKNGGKL